MARFQLSLRTLMVAVFACGFIAWLAHGVRQAREAARQSACSGHFSQLTLALLLYHDAYGCFPPAAIADAQGRPMHSWRVLLLPFLSEDALYAAYNFNEPWNGPNNSKLAIRMPTIYACPSHRGDIHDAGYRGTIWTSYLAITGPGTVFPDGRTASVADVRDGASRTIMLAEVANVDIPWMEPRDLRIDATDAPSHPRVSSFHPVGAGVGFVDRTYRTLPPSTPPGALRALMTIDGGEAIRLD